MSGEESAVDMEKTGDARARTAKISIDDGESRVEIKITGRSEEELYDVYRFISRMRKDPGNYQIELLVDESGG